MRWFTIKGLHLSINAFIPFPFSFTMLQSMEFNNNNNAVIFLSRQTLLYFTALKLAYTHSLLPFTRYVTYLLVMQSVAKRHAIA